MSVENNIDLGAIPADLPELTQVKEIIIILVYIQMIVLLNQRLLLQTVYQMLL